MKKEPLEQATSFVQQIYLYGPPGSGKTLIGEILAENLALPFVDLDQRIESQTGISIPQIFAQRGEAGFRQIEKQALLEMSKMNWGVIALGGGALLETESRILAEKSGSLICLSASKEILFERLSSTQAKRPLLGQGTDQSPQLVQLDNLLAQRSAHYASFANQIETGTSSPQQVAREIQIRLGVFHVRGMAGRTFPNHVNGTEAERPETPGYDVRISPILDRIGEALSMRGMAGPVALVTDQNVADYYLNRVKKSLLAAGYSTRSIILPPGESTKTMPSVSSLWQEFLEAGLERKSTVVALGGGVVGDLAGFAAATYLRGIAWVNVPTTLLAMVDASLGGKTGIDLPAGKNLAGAFHAPQVVLVDPSTLLTLPQAEQRSGMAEVIKAGVIRDPVLFDLCRREWQEIEAGWGEIIPRSMAVKLDIIEADPYEKGLRAVLNYGHTVGHAVEVLSNYKLRHGEAVAIGMVAEARLAEEIGLAKQGLADEIRDVCQQIGLPVEIPAGYLPEEIIKTIQLDKKRADGKVKFALPIKIGEVSPGIDVIDFEPMFH
ncbi:MAG: 3-dehydroquinate synthase [Anaerolineales bacterium]